MNASSAFADSSNKITFVCTGNTGRSVTAEYLAKEYIPNITANGYEFQSRGTNATPGSPPEENAVIVMQDIHIDDMSAHKSQQLTDGDVKDSKIVLTMTKAQKDTVTNSISPGATNVYMLSECADGTQTDVADAYNKALLIYVYTRNQITGYLDLIHRRGGKCYNSSAKL